MSQNLSDTQTLLDQAIDRHPLMVPAETTVSNAIATMNQTRASYTLIVEHQKLLGIFTERDVVKIAASQMPLEGVTISQVMAQNLITLSIAEAGNIFNLLALLRSSRIRHLPILDEQGHVLGVVTPESLRAILKPTDLLQMGRVAQIMATVVMTAPTTASVFDIAQQMATHRKSCVVICQESGVRNQESVVRGQGSNEQQLTTDNAQLTPVGIITERDIVKFAASGLNLVDTSVEAVMSCPLLPVDINATLWEAHRMMEQHRIRRLVVVDEAGYLAGLVTQSTLLYALDPVEMYATVELLHQTITEKTQELRNVNHQMQAEVIQRQQAEEKLRQAKENLEAQVKARTLELTQANAQLKQEIQDRIEAEAEVRRLNAELEQRVQERTAQLRASNQKLQQEISASEAAAMHRQLLEAKLHSSESKMRTVFEAMTDIILVLNTEGNVEVVPTNTASAYKPDFDIIGHTIEQFFQNESAENWLLQIQRVLDTQQRLNFDYSLTLGDQELWFTACISPMSSNSVIWVAHDISDRKLAESALYQKNEELANTLQELKLTQQELIQSEKMAALGQLVAGVAHEINTPLGAIRSSVENIADFLNQNLEHIPQFLQGLSEENHSYFFALLRNSSQQVTSFSAKEKRQFKRALIHQLESQNIENADTIADTFVDLGVYDDIYPFLPLLQDPDSKNILNSAYQLASLQKSAATIRTAADRAAKVVFALKTYSRYESTNQKVESNLIEGIETILTLYHNQLKQGVEVIRNYEVNLPLITCYPDELNQVWTNLIDNALQAMKNKGTLKIDVRNQDNQLQVSITDSGQGIPPEVLPKIFQPFFTTKAVGEGSGLGLDIVKKIIEKHQGKIEVESIPNKTTLTVFLPLDVSSS